MNDERLLKVLLAPHISEKSALAADSLKQHTFRVLPDATKDEIKAAVEQLFEVKVAAVRVVKMKGKQKRFGQVMGRRKDWKKAYVTLAEDADINFIGSE